MADDFVHNDEILYRRIIAGRNLYKRKPDGSIEINSQAFYEGESRISVDRASLCNNDPRHTLNGFEGGVVSFVTSEIRNINDLARNQRGENTNTTQYFIIEVEPAPIPNNIAHAEICAIPAFTDADKRGAYKKLCRRLARLAEEKPWEIFPNDQ